ncbi:MAG: 6-phosphogluconolactonase [Bryobacteraceae bacterium]
MSVRWHTYPGPDEAAEACGHHIAALLEEAVAGQECASLALSGGTSPVRLFRNLAGARLPWNRIHIFWVDERCVPPSDPQSNYRLAEEHLIRPAHIPQRQVHRIDGELHPEHAARRYVQEIQDFFNLEPGGLPHFDVMQLGMGTDAHTASLFPGSPLIEDRERIAAALFAEQQKQWRVTLLPGVIMAARHTVFLVTGEEKAEAVRNVFKGEYDASRYPAQMASHHSRRVAWFLDDAAAALMD